MRACAGASDATAVRNRSSLARATQGRFVARHGWNLDGARIAPRAPPLLPSVHLESASMTITLAGLVFFLIIAAICGAIGRAIAGEVRGGLAVSIALGFLGAMLGPWLAGQLGLPEPFAIHFDGQTFPILWSIVGATLCVALIHLFSRRGPWARR